MFRLLSYMHTSGTTAFLLAGCYYVATRSSVFFFVLAIMLTRAELRIRMRFIKSLRLHTVNIKMN